MQAGRMDRRIILQRASVVQDATGHGVATWFDIGTVWASWRRASARETLAAAEVSAQVTDVFEIRWQHALSDLNPKDQVEFDGRGYDIAEVTEIGRREGLRIAASARSDR